MNWEEIKTLLSAMCIVFVILSVLGVLGWLNLLIEHPLLTVFGLGVGYSILGILKAYLKQRGKNYG